MREIYDGVKFLGQDDKAKISCFDEVLISLGVWTNDKGIAAANYKGLKAMDHDFHNSNIILSAILCCNIPKSMGRSFFIGNEDGRG